MATKKASAKARTKEAEPITMLAPCCSRAIDLVLEGTVFSAEIQGTKFDAVTTISLKSVDPMTVFGLSPKGLLTSTIPWEVFIVKGESGQTLVLKEGKVTAKGAATKTKTKSKTKTKAKTKKGK
jgi:hypothetical protein